MSEIAWILAVILLLLAGAGFLYNQLWTYSTVALVALLLLSFLAARKNTAAKALIFLFPFLIVLLLGVVGKWPLHPRYVAYGASSFPVLQNTSVATLLSDADRVPSAPVDTRARLQQRVFSELSALNGVDRAATEASRIWEIVAVLPTVGWFHGDLSGLKSAMAELESRFTGVHDIQALSSQVSDLRVFLEASLASIGKTPDEGLGKFEGDFDIKLRQFPAWQLTWALAQARNQLSVALSDAAPSRVVSTEAATVRLNRAEDSWVVTETYRFDIPLDVKVSELDATDLLLETRTRAFSQLLRVAYATGDTVPDSGPVFRINPSARSFVLLNTVTIRPDSATEYRTPMKPLRVKWITFRWPDPFSVRVRLTANLSSRGLAGATPLYVALDRTTPLEHFLIPKHSYLASHLPFTVVTSNEGDILTPKSELKPEYFATHRFIWFEILPPGLLSRNGIVSRYRNYIFAENLAVALLIAAGTAFFAAIVKKP
jgi:hypothetical protein